MGQFAHSQEAVEVMAASPATTSAKDLLELLAHELRTPLATLHVTLELLADLSRLPPDEAAQLVRQLMRSVSWIDMLVENLTAQAALEQNTLVLQSSRLQVATWLEEASALVQPLLDGRRQRLTLAGLGEKLEVVGDARWLRQVVVNLLANASAYSPVGASIIVTVDADEDGVAVAVTDQGPGIPLEEQEGLFARYQRGSAGIQHRAIGMGLGLYLVKTVIELHGGSVGVRSTPGQGATLWLRLPMAMVDHHLAIGQGHALDYRATDLLGPAL
jgi:signal transduction histidine kinase